MPFFHFHVGSSPDLWPSKMSENLIFSAAAHDKISIDTKVLGMGRCAVLRMLTLHSISGRCGLNQQDMSQALPEPPLDRHQWALGLSTVVLCFCRAVRRGSARGVPAVS